MTGKISIGDGPTGARVPEPSNELLQRWGRAVAEELMLCKVTAGFERDKPSANTVRATLRALQDNPERIGDGDLDEVTDNLMLDQAIIYKTRLGSRYYEWQRLAPDHIAFLATRALESLDRGPGQRWRVATLGPLAILQAFGLANRIAAMPDDDARELVETALREMGFGYTRQRVSATLSELRRPPPA